MFDIPAQEKKAEVPPVTAPDESTLVLRESPAETTGAVERPINAFGVWDFVRMILVLALVIGLIYGVFQLLKKLSAPRDGGVRSIGVLETHVLAGNRSLHLVEVGNHILLIGSSEGAVSLVAEISDKETLDGIRLKASEASSGAGVRNFSDLLKGFLVRKDSRTDGSLDFMKRQRERLKKLP